MIYKDVEVGNGHCLLTYPRMNTLQIVFLVAASLSVGEGNVPNSGNIP